MYRICKELKKKKKQQFKVKYTFKQIFFTVIAT